MLKDWFKSRTFWGVFILAAKRVVEDGLQVVIPPAFGAIIDAVGAIIGTMGVRSWFKPAPTPPTT